MKENEKVVVPSFPHIQDLDTWMTTLIHNLAHAAAVKDDAELVRWIRNSWSDIVTYEQLEDSEPFVTLDRKLSTALIAMLKNTSNSPDAKTLFDKLTIRMGEAQRDNKLVRGRQIVFLIVRHFRTPGNLAYKYTTKKLEDLTPPTNIKALQVYQIDFSRFPRI